MSIVRGSRPEANFTIIRNELLSDGLSCEALGVICYLLSKPDNWEISKRELGKHFRIGRDKINRIINELLKAGYMETHQPRSRDGKVLESVFVCLDQKRSETAVDWKSAPFTEKPYSLKHAEILCPIEHLRFLPLYV